MKNEKIVVQNIKCNGCSNSIINALGKITDISNIEVDVENESVSFDFDTEKAKDQVIDKLSKMGYPLVEAPNSLGSQAKSYVSCMIGRMQKEA